MYKSIHNKVKNQLNKGGASTKSKLQSSTFLTGTNYLFHELHLKNYDEIVRLAPLSHLTNQRYQDNMRAAFNRLGHGREEILKVVSDFYRDRASTLFARYPSEMTETSNDIEACFYDRFRRGSYTKNYGFLDSADGFLRSIDPEYKEKADKISESLERGDDMPLENPESKPADDLDNGK